MNSDHAPTPLARALGYAGLLPFIAGAAATLLLADAAQARAAHALAAYAATIVAFLGGIHWGLAARGRASAAQFAWGVVPSLIAWGALLLPSRTALLVLAAALVACYAVDRVVWRVQGLAAWLRLRFALTGVAVGCCIAGAIAR